MPQRSVIIVNLVTMSRGVLIALFTLLAIWNELAPHLALGISSIMLLVLSGLTDFLDGWLARRWKATTPFGALADPLMDKLFYATTLPTILFIAAFRGETGHAVILLFLTISFLIRDQWVTFLRSVGAQQGADLRANWSGKLRTLLSFPIIMIVYSVLALDLGLVTLLIVCEGLALSINLISIWVYTQFYWPHIRLALQNDNPPRS
ncbi:MAG: CDP-alcohol phosphatidyltransferase family protein [Verrucomicrobiota bacterium]